MKTVTQQLKIHYLAVIISLTFALLGLTYSIVTPPFEISDETRHYAVIKYMADTAKLPVQEPGEAQRHWSHEGNQPPLYYALAALLTARIDTGNWNDVYWYNPHTSVGVPLRSDNENMTIHTAQEAFPWRGYALAVHLIRFMSVVMGTITVVFTYLVALDVFKGHRQLAAGATAIAAFTPMFIFISAGMNNDNLVILFCTLAIWMLVKMAQSGSGKTRVITLGVFIGLGALSKLYALGMLPLAGMLFLWQGFSSRNWRKFWLNSLLLGGVVLLIAGWWYARNQLLYGDLLALHIMGNVAGTRDIPLTLPIFLAEFQGLRIAYWALFGGVNVLAHTWIYKILDIVALVAALSLTWMILLWIKKRGSFLQKRLYPQAVLILLGWAGIMFGGFLVWNFTQPAAQGRLFYPAIAAISILLAVGLSWPLPPENAWLPPAILGFGLFIFAALSPWLYIAPAYAKPPLLKTADIPADITPIGYVFNDEIRLVGVKMNAGPVRALETLPITVYWEVLKPMPVNYSVFVHLYGRQGETMGQFDSYPGLGAWPTTLLSPGDVLADTYLVPLFEGAEKNAPALLQAAIGLYEYNKPGFPRPPVYSADGAEIETPLAGQAKLIPWVWPKAQPTHPLNAQFEDGITLTGYDSTCNRAAPCQLTLHWIASRRPSAAYQVFIQLWQGDEQVGGFDGPPVKGDYPTNWWDAGEIIVDRHPVDLSRLPPGDYRFRVGLYRLDTGQRLPVSNSAGFLSDFAVDLPLTIP